MPAGSELTSAAIAPGSTDYGDRQKLEGSLSAIVGQQGGGAASAPGGGSPGPVVPEDALGALMSGQISPGGDLPLTDGLSVGPGAGPAAQQEDPLLGDRANRLRMIASQAASPQLRALARSELKRMTREPI